MAIGYGNPALEEAAALARQQLAQGGTAVAPSQQQAEATAAHELGQQNAEHAAAVNHLASLHPTHPLVRLTHSLAVNATQQQPQINSFGPYTGAPVPAPSPQINSFGPYTGAPVPAPPGPQINSFPPYTGGQL